jgi:L-fuculose-phosphate aldolase
MLEAERERVAAAARRLAEEGLVLGTAGNISQRAGDRIAVTPSGAALANLDPGDMVIVDLDGNRLEGHGAPTSELDLHLGVYRRYGAGAVVHMHAPFATALACVIDELPAVHYQLLALGGPIRVAPYATFGSPELAQLTLDALQGRSAALMANHGAIVHGRPRRGDGALAPAGVGLHGVLARGRDRDAAGARSRPVGGRGIGGRPPQLRRPECRPAMIGCRRQTRR